VLSTDAGWVGGLARSSGEAPVMGVERRGQTIVICSVDQPHGGRNRAHPNDGVGVPGASVVG